MKRYIVIIALFISLVASAQEPQRISYLLNSDWEFFSSSEYERDDAEHITLPHVWNDDVMSGTGEYLRSSANYMRRLYIPSSIGDKRLFLRFGAVQSVATLFVNGKYVGEHRGGFTAFTFEITDKVIYDSENVIQVVVSNDFRSDVLPVSTDQNLYGGIYRDVELLVTNKSVISPLFFSTDGVLVEQHEVSQERIKGVVRVYVSAENLGQMTVSMRMVDASGNEVLRRSARASKSDPSRGIELPFEFESPQLWSPSSPELYTVEVSLIDGLSLCDRVDVVTGFRSITIRDDNRLCINGEPMEVKGVNMPHDRVGVATAVSHSNIEADMSIVADMGVNAIRSLTGPHDDYMYDYCDKKGIMVWIDAPFTRAQNSFADICYYPTPSFKSNGLEQLHEIILQNFNHPSVVMWGLFSLVWQRGEDVIPYITTLNDMAHSLDPSRPTVGCSNTDGKINFITDLIVLRQNVGWYKGRYEDVYVWCDQLSSNPAWSMLRYGICYGEEGMVAQQTDDLVRAERGSRNLPERRQSILHERYAEAISSNNIFWGVWLNSMFDYASSRSLYGLYQSGLVGFKRTKYKDAYYLYRAMWNETDATLHIAERRWSGRRDTLQSFKVYASDGCPLLLINADTLPLRQSGKSLWIADSVVVHGRARLRAYNASGERVDSMDITTGSLRVRR